MIIPFETYPNRSQRDEIAAYILNGAPLSSFLEAVICNDLMEACSRADCINQQRLWAIASWLYNYAPMRCRGDIETYDAWVRAGGLAGLQKQTSKVYGD